MVAAPRKDPQHRLSHTLRSTAAAMGEGQISLREQLALVGEQGMLLFCLLLTVPFLLPVSIPGISSVFGLLILFIGITLTNTLPAWAILLLATGMLQRDGCFVALGYALVAATLIWFAVLALGVLMAGQGLSGLFG